LPSKNSALYSFGGPSINPNFNSVQPFKPIIPDVELNELDVNVLDLKDSYELPNKNPERYKEIFDPKLRKKLQELPPRLLMKPKFNILV
jgi:hypothetical protein